MSNKDVRYLKSVETVENTYPPAKGFCDPENINGTAADKVIIAQNNIIIELLIQIQNLVAHSLSSQTPAVNPSLLEGLHQSLATLSLNRPSSKLPARKFVVQTDPNELIKEYRKQNGGK